MPTDKRTHTHTYYRPCYAVDNDLKTNVRLIIPIHTSIKAEYVVKIGRARSKIIGQICQFLQFFHSSTKIGNSFSGITEHHQLCTRCSYI